MGTGWWIGQGDLPLAEAPRLLVQGAVLLGALLVGLLSAWATLRALAAYGKEPARLPVMVLLAWLPPLLGPLAVLLLTRGPQGIAPEDGRNG